MTEATKQCPFCAETIQAAAVVCRYCNRDLPRPSDGPPRVVRSGEGYACSACGGFVRPDAEECKHCKVSFRLSDRQAPKSPMSERPKRSPLVIGIAFGFLLLIGAFMLFGSGTRGRSPTAPASSTYRVTYKVTGTAQRVSLTYNNAGGDSEQKDAPVPWEQGFDARVGHFVYVAAQNKGETGTVVCEILVNGTSVKKTTSEGAYKIATCSGRL